MKAFTFSMDGKYAYASFIFMCNFTSTAVCISLHSICVDPCLMADCFTAGIPNGDTLVRCVEMQLRIAGDIARTAEERSSASILSQHLLQKGLEYYQLKSSSSCEREPAGCGEDFAHHVSFVVRVSSHGAKFSVSCCPIRAIVLENASCTVLRVSFQVQNANSKPTRS